MKYCESRLLVKKTNGSEYCKDTRYGVHIWYTGISFAGERRRRKNMPKWVFYNVGRVLYRARSQIALFQKVESAICDRGYYMKGYPNYRMNVKRKASYTV